MGTVKLFCIPPAGMSAVSYSAWKAYASESIDVFPVELAGRGMRYKDAPYETFEDIVDDVFDMIQDENGEQAYALFGHCMGSWIIYELCSRISLSGQRPPVHVFFSGKEAPHVTDNKQIHRLPDEEFIAEVMGLGGTSEDFIKDRDMLNMFLPILRNDFTVVERHKFKNCNYRLPCGISVFYGQEDTCVKSRINEWNRYTEGNCSFYEFEGGHFFIYNHMEKVIDTINRILV